MRAARAPRLHGVVQLTNSDDPLSPQETDSVLRGVIDSTMAELRCRQARCGVAGRTLVAGGRVNLVGHAFDLVAAGTPWTGARRPSLTSPTTRQRDPVHVDVLRVLGLVDPSWSALRRVDQPDMERLDVVRSCSRVYGVL